MFGNFRWPDACKVSTFMQGVSMYILLLIPNLHLCFVSNSINIFMCINIEKTVRLFFWGMIYSHRREMEWYITYSLYVYSYAHNSNANVFILDNPCEKLSDNKYYLIYSL